MPMESIDLNCIVSLKVALAKTFTFSFHQAYFMIATGT
jgi:hypothetical protein